MSLFDRERVHQRQFGRAGIAEQDLDAFLLQHFKERAFSGNDGQGFLRLFLVRADGGTLLVERDLSENRGLLFGMMLYLRSRYLCSPVSTSSPFWLWMVAAITTMPVVRCGISPAMVNSG